MKTHKDHEDIDGYRDQSAGNVASIVRCGGY